MSKQPTLLVSMDSSWKRVISPIINGKCSIGGLTIESEKCVGFVGTRNNKIYLYTSFINEINVNTILFKKYY